MSLQVESEPWAILEATDGTGRIVGVGIGSLDLEAPQGLYRVTALGPHRSRRLLVDLDAGQHRRQLPLRDDSPAPFASAISGRVHQVAGAQTVRERAGKFGSGVLIFIRDPDNVLDPAVLKLRVLKPDGECVGTMEDAVCKPHLGWSALLLEAEPGAYFIVTEDGPPRGSRTQVVYVAPNAVTQVYAIWRGYIDLSAATAFVDSVFDLAYGPPIFVADTPRIEYRLRDTAQQFVLQGQWDRVGLLLARANSPQITRVDVLAEALRLYARRFVAPTSPDLADEPASLGDTGEQAAIVPDEMLLRALNQKRVSANPSEMWNALAESIPAFSVGTNMLLVASRRLTEAAPTTPNYLTDLWTRFIPEGVWTQWRGADPLRPQLLSADFAVIKAALDEAQAPRSAAYLAAETGQPASVVASELDAAVSEKPSRSNDQSAGPDAQVAGAGLGTVTSYLRSALEYSGLEPSRFLYAVSHPYQKQITTLEAPGMDRRYGIEKVFFDGIWKTVAGVLIFGIMVAGTTVYAGIRFVEERQPSPQPAFSDVLFLQKDPAEWTAARATLAAAAIVDVTPVPLVAAGTLPDPRAEATAAAEPYLRVLRQSDDPSYVKFRFSYAGSVPTQKLWIFAQSPVTGNYYPSQPAETVPPETAFTSIHLDAQTFGQTQAYKVYVVSLTPEADTAVRNYLSALQNDNTLGNGFTQLPVGATVIAHD